MKTLRVKVRPNARANALEQQVDGTWVAQVKAPPVDGKANDALVALIAKHFARRKSQVTVKHGATGRTKVVSVDDD
jgi:uncharacterized protein